MQEETNLNKTTGPRIEAVRQHFQEWHGAAPDDAEITALLHAIDMAQFYADSEESILADCKRRGVEPVRCADDQR